MNGKPVLLLRLHDLSGERKAQQRLTHLANFDSLTGLPNRALFRDRLAQAMARCAAQRHADGADVPRPRPLQARQRQPGPRGRRPPAAACGADALTHCLRDVDSVAATAGDEPFTLSRLGGDEFTVIAEDDRHAEDAALIARRLLDALNAPFMVGDEELVVSASIGISMYPTDDVDLDGLIRHTDMAMYRSKSLGRSTYSFFSDDLNAAVAGALSLEGSLRHAIERDEFQLHFQPKADLRTGERSPASRPCLRWHRPGHGMVPPDRFIACSKTPA